MIGGEHSIDGLKTIRNAYGPIVFYFYRLQAVRFIKAMKMLI